MTVYEKIARERYRKLWDFYNEHGKILMQDCYDILGTKILSHIWLSFERHNLGNEPPIWDRAQDKYERYADLLNTEANRKGVNELTLDEMAKVLGKRRSNMPWVREQCKRHGYKIPDTWKIRKQKVTDELLDEMDLDETELHEEYPQGIEVSSWRSNPANSKEVIYMLR